VPYKGTGALVGDLIAGHLSLAFADQASMMPQVKAGKLRALAVGGLNRSPEYPDIPTIAEQGLPGFETGSWQGIVAAPGTPREIIAKLNAELTRILNTADMKEKLGAQGTEVRTDTPESMATFLGNERVRWAKVVKESGIKFD